MLPSSVARLVLAEPTPPRAVKPGQLLKEVLKERTAKSLIAFGATFLLFGFLMAAFRFGVSSESDALVGYGIAALGAVVTATPIVFWGRLLSAVRFAPLGNAIVQRLQFEGSSLDTLDASTNGMARGTWLVQAGDREFSEAFENDTPWARELKPGSAVRVLVHPTKARTMFAVEIANAA